CHGALRDVPSFPTRRSSDLVLLHEMLVGVKPERRDDETLRLPSALLRSRDHAETLAQRRRLSLSQLRRRINGDLDMILRQALRRSEEHTSELQSRENLVCRL